VPDAAAVLRSAHSVLVIDWPSRDVPDGLAYVHGVDIAQAARAL
jgi:hypothetical protein